MTLSSFTTLRRLAACGLASVGLVGTAQAALITSSAGLPPDGVYLGPTEVHAIYGGSALQFLLSLIEHQPFASTADRRPGGSGAAGDANDEIEMFQTQVRGIMEVKAGGSSVGIVPIVGQGPA